VFDVDGAKHIIGLVTSIGAALGGLWKFLVWLKERPSSSKSESAKALAEWKSRAVDSDEIRRFGETEVLRAHFKVLTGIDRRNDHAALLRAHAKLGGTDYDWRRLRSVAAYLERMGKDMVVRNLTGADHATAAISVALVLMGVASAFFFIDGLQSVAGSDKGPPAGRLAASLVLGILAIGVLIVAWLFSVVLFHMIVTAREVRKKLAASDVVGQLATSAAARRVPNSHERPN
jgi:hypothetical protein